MMLLLLLHLKTLLVREHTILDHVAINLLRAALSTSIFILITVLNLHIAILNSADGRVLLLLILALVSLILLLRLLDRLFFFLFVH